MRDAKVAVLAVKRFEVALDAVRALAAPPAAALATWLQAGAHPSR